MDRISSNHVYALILTRSALGLLPANFPKFETELLPLIDVRFLILFNILRSHGQNFIKFCICIDTDKTYLGIVTCHFFFRKFVTELWPLIGIRFHFPSITLEPVGRISTKFCFCIDTDKIYLRIVTCHFSQICKQSYGHNGP